MPTPKNSQNLNPLLDADLLTLDILTAQRTGWSLRVGYNLALEPYHELVSPDGVTNHSTFEGEAAAWRHVPQFHKYIDPVNFLDDKGLLWSMGKSHFTPKSDAKKRSDNAYFCKIWAGNQTFHCFAPTVRIATLFAFNYYKECHTE